MTVWTPTALSGSDAVDLQVAQWGNGTGSSIKVGDTFLPLARGDLVDRSIQVEGTFGGATINILGSNDNTVQNPTNGNFHPLHDPFNNLINISAAGLFQILEITAWMMPQMSGASGSTNLTITTCQRLSR